MTKLKVAAERIEHDGEKTTITISEQSFQEIEDWRNDALFEELTYCIEFSAKEKKAND